MSSGKLSFLGILLVLLCVKSYAGTIKGYVSDKKSGEQIIGALVVLEGTKMGTVTALDGKFIITDVPEGSYKLKIQYISYDTWEQDIVLDKDQVISIKAELSEKSSALKEVRITGKYNRGSDEEALNKERYGHEIMNVVSARSIEISPDITVASVLQRVSGLSIENSNSGNQYVVIRGMDKKYNTVLVNGVKIPSPNDKDRYVPVDLFPAELLERLEVVKTLSPGMEGDAGGGVINLVMKDAPEKLIADANLGVGYSDIFQHQDFLKYSTGTINLKSPAELLPPGAYATQANFPYQNLITTNLATPINSVYGATLGNRFFKNKLGAIISGSYQNTYKGYNSATYLQSPTLAPSSDKYTPSQQTFSDLNYREYSTLSQRLGAMTKLDYRLNDKNSFSLFGGYFMLNEYRTRFTVDSQLGGYSVAGGYVGYVGIHHRIETRSTLQNIANVTLQGKHKFTDYLLADWSLVSSQAEQQLPDDAQFSYSQKVNNNNGALSLGTPFVSSEDRNWYRNTDKDLSGYANLHYNPTNIKGLQNIDIGGMYRHKTRDNFTNKYTLQQVNDSASNFENYTSLQNTKLTFTPANTALGTYAFDPGTYNFTEDILAYFVQVNYDITGRLNVFGGLRVENTNSGYSCNLPVTVAGKSANYTYTDYLPSIQFKYALTEKSNLRASYFTSIYRPAYGDLIPNPQTVSFEDYDFVGNPYLQHTVIYNSDVRYEFFPKGLDQFMVGVFDKVINNPIEYEVSQETRTSEDITPKNFGTANNFGFELVFRKYFGSFGIGGNYTYTHSAITTNKQVYYNDTTASKNGPIYDSVKQTRPLVGQSAHIGNISLLYKSTKYKANAQLAFVYTGERINLLSRFYGLDLWQKPTISLDFSAEKQIGKHFIVYVKANNLLNSGFELFIKQKNPDYSTDSKLRYQESSQYITVEKDFYKASFLIGGKFKL